MINTYHLRIASLRDRELITRLFRETIRHVNIRDYDTAQVEAWSLGADHTDRWTDRIKHQHFLLAFEGDTLAGFASITQQGYLDTMYVGRFHQKKGVGKQLYDALEAYARQRGLPDISSDVSITARPFFEHQGFKVLQAQEVTLRGQTLRNFRMTKSIASQVNPG